MNWVFRSRSPGLNNITNIVLFTEADSLPQGYKCRVSAQTVGRQQQTRESAADGPGGVGNQCNIAQSTSSKIKSEKLFNTLFQQTVKSVSNAHR